ncbi:MAG: uncharacterized protein K0R38_3282 [Polyangiaceae bacterium]|nr:uncharacterized protein [Polyangiaceae bacterium]
MQRWLSFRLVRSLAPRALLWGLAFGALPLACGSDKVKSPFGPGAGGEGGDAGAPGSAGFRLDVDGGDELDPTLGGPCEDDGQCDDDVDCTEDRCDSELGRCRFAPNDARCDDPIYCDGVERCDPRAGCVEGEVVACSDNSTCTIDTCDEATKSCRHDPRDADGDGDPVRNCGGRDCDDDDPLVGSGSTEVCGNRSDDDCDGSVDELDCSSPAHDRCDDALQVTEPGTYALDLTAARLDFPSECAPDKTSYRDVVLEVTLPEGGPYDLDVTAKADIGRLVLGVASECGAAVSSCTRSYARSGRDVSAQVACTRDSKQDDMACGRNEAYSCDDLEAGAALVTAFDGTCSQSLDVKGAVFGFCCPPPEASVSRVILRGVEAGRYPLYLAGDVEGSAQVRVDFRPAEPQSGELCEDAVSLVANGDPVLLRLPGYATDEDTECSSVTPRLGDAFVGFTLTEPRDVTLVAESQNELGVPLLSLLDASCTLERTCRRSQPGRLFDRNLPAGTYRALVSATGPDDVSIRLQTAPVSDAPPGEGCNAPLTLAAGVEQIVELATHEDAVDPGCVVGAPDAAFQLELSDVRDVMLVGRFSDGDTGAVAFVDDTCDTNFGCDGAVPARAVRYRMPKGKHRAVIESSRGNPVGMSFLERRVTSPVVVPFAENCDAPVTVSELGGRFTGNTSNAFPDFDAGCDRGGQAPGGAPDQLLKMSLSAPRRVVLDMRNSEYRTMLSVRKGSLCPGAEVPMACAPGYWSTRSFLDLELQAGDYFIQIDGYDGDSGPWKLDVFTAPL